MTRDYKTYWNSKGEYGVIRVQRMVERKAKRKAKKGNPHACSCGRTGTRTIHPYYADMFGEERWVVLCRSCYEDVCGDI